MSVIDAVNTDVISYKTNLGTLTLSYVTGCFNSGYLCTYQIIFINDQKSGIKLIIKESLNDIDTALREFNYYKEKIYNIEK